MTEPVFDVGSDAALSLDGFLENRLLLNRLTGYGTDTSPIHQYPICAGGTLI